MGILRIMDFMEEDSGILRLWKKMITKIVHLEL